MKKSIIFAITLISICFGGAVGYSFGSSNIMTYPSFTGKPPSGTSDEDLQKYLESCEVYVRACQNDIEMITIERDKVVEQAQRYVEKYQKAHMKD